MKKTVMILLAAVMIFAMSACVNVDATNIGDLLNRPEIQDALSQVDMEKVGEAIERMGAGDLIGQMIEAGIPGMTEQAPVEISEDAETDAEKMRFKTIGEAIEAADEFYSYGRNNPEYFTYVFSADGIPYRVTCKLDEEQRKEIDEIDWIESSEERDKAMTEYISTLAVTIEEDLRKYYPSQEELDGWKGQPGQAFIDAGYEMLGFNVDDDDVKYMEFTKGLFDYAVVMNEDYKDLDHAESEFPEMTIKSVRVLLRPSSESLDLNLTE